jgi:mannose/cellobiose epimerase-like protein (N-acyl-D-glucosamine 2-epimerase family)
MTLNRRLTISLGIAALLGAAVVQAAELKQADVPFAFSVAGQRLEAGPYNATLSNGGALLIQNYTTRHSVYLIPLPAGERKIDQSSMTFLCYGSNCFLSQVTFAQSGTVYKVRPSKHEQELAKVERPAVTLIAMR